MEDIFDIAKSKVLNQNSAKTENGFNFDNLTEEEFSVIYIDEFGDMPDEEFNNFFGSRKRKGKATPGGKKWSKNEAKRFDKQVAGKVESSRTYLKNIIGQDPHLVKDKRKKDFEQMVWASKQNQTKLETAWTNYQKARAGGWENDANRETARVNFNTIVTVEANAKRDWKDRHDWVTEGVIDKVGTVLKVINLAVGRELLLLFLEFNFINMASQWKLMQLRKPNDYIKIRNIYKSMGGKRTSIDKYIEKGYKKRPLLATKMKIDWDKAVKNPTLSADGEQSTVKTSDAIMAIVPTITSTGGSILGTKIGPPYGNIIGAGAGTIVGSIVDLLLNTTNDANIPLYEGEKNGEYDPNAKSFTPDEVKALKEAAEEVQKEGKKTDNWIPKVPNAVTVVVSSVLFSGAIIGALAAAGVFKKKAKKS